MTDPRHSLGVAAEEAVARWLASLGWHIVGRRWRSTPGGEVDIVALDTEGVLVAVEVRARRTARTGMAALSVDERRLARLGRTLAAFGASRQLRHSALRVDLVTVEPAGDANGCWRVVRIPGLE